MRNSKYLLRIATTGLLTLVLLSILLFALRKTCQIAFYEGVVFDKTRNKDVRIRKGAIYDTYGIAQEEKQHDLHWPNGYPFRWRFHRGEEVIWSLYAKEKNRYEFIYFDNPSGQFVHCEIVKETEGTTEKWVKKIRHYAGPEGMTKTLSPSTKSFRRHLLPTEGGSPKEIVIYDQDRRRFFRINFTDGSVVKGPELGDHHPVQIGYVKLKKNPKALRIEWPNKDVAPPIGVVKNKMLVLDKSGRIDYLDLETLDYSGTAGTLLSGENILGRKIDDLAAYLAFPIMDENKLHKGLVAITVPRNLFFISAQNFDTKGKSGGQESQWVQGDQWAGGPLYFVGRYLLENLQPAALSVASYATAHQFEATAGERALFLLSNSFVAMFSRDQGEAVLVRWIVLLLIISPSLLLGGFLGWRVVRDAKVVGLDKPARRWWLVGTVLFGLSAYLTYRLTRPKEVLVTCENCGKLRRPDFDRCHHCQSDWELAELQPPPWSVCAKYK